VSFLATPPQLLEALKRGLLYIFERWRQLLLSRCKFQTLEATFERWNCFLPLILQFVLPHLKHWVDFRTLELIFKRWSRSWAWMAKTVSSTVQISLSPSSINRGSPPFRKYSPHHHFLSSSYLLLPFSLSLFSSLNILGIFCSKELSC